MDKLYDTPIKAIRKKCLNCTLNQPKEIRYCTSYDCDLYPYRMGTRPSKETMDTLEKFYKKNVSQLRISKCLISVYQFYVLLIKSLACQGLLIKKRYPGILIVDQYLACLQQIHQLVELFIVPRMIIYMPYITIGKALVIYLYNIYLYILFYLLFMGSNIKLLILLYLQALNTETYAPVG